MLMAKAVTKKKRIVRREWTTAEVKELRQHSKDKTPVKMISKTLKRTPAALRQKAHSLRIRLGHRRATRKK
jgi:hypothetical protein